MSTTTTCTRCSHYARLNGQPEPEYHAHEVNPATGLCWNVCDLEYGAASIEHDAYTSLSDE